MIAPSEDRRVSERRCFDCSGYMARLDDHEGRLDGHDTAIKSLWKDKLGNWWMVFIIPFLVIWLAFQGEVYDGVKNIQKDVAVIQTTLKLDRMAVQNGHK